MSDSTDPVKDPSDGTGRRWRRLGRETVREIVVVVASILIAFGLDAWWDGQTEKRELQDQLGGVLVELEAGRRQIAEAAMAHRMHARAAGAFRDRLVQNDAGSTVAVPDTLVGALFSWFVMDVTTTATTAFVDAGGLELLASDLGAELRNWPAVMADAVDDEAQLRSVVQDGYQPYMTSHVPLGDAIDAGSEMIRRAILTARGEPVPDFTAPRSSVPVRATLEMINLLSWRETNENTRARQMDALLARQEDLISGVRARRVP